MNRSAHIPEALDRASLRGFLFLGLFAGLILAKCAVSEALRLSYGIEIDSALYVWMPSLLILAVLCVLYIRAPWVGFHPYWQTVHFLAPAFLIGLTVLFSIVRELPSVLVPVSLSVLLAVGIFVLGQLFQSLPVRFLALVWLFAALVEAFYPAEWSYGIFAVLLVLGGTLPAAIGYVRLRPVAGD